MREIEELIDSVAFCVRYAGNSISKLSATPVDDPRSYAQACPREADQRELAQAYSDTIDALENLEYLRKALREYSGTPRIEHDILVDVMEDVRWHDPWGRYTTAHRVNDRIRFYDSQEQRWFEIVILPSEAPAKCAKQLLAA